MHRRVPHGPSLPSIGFSSSTSTSAMSQKPPNTSEKEKSNGAHHNHNHDHDHDHAHTGLFHAHSHDHKDGAEQIMRALQAGRADRGTRITLIGASGYCLPA